MKLCASASPAEDLFELARPSAKRIPHSLKMVEVLSGFELLATGDCRDPENCGEVVSS
jgi:hypothetical protein